MDFFLVSEQKLQSILDGDMHDLGDLVESCREIELTKIDEGVWQE